MDEVNAVTDFPEELQHRPVHYRLPARSSSQKRQGNSTSKEKIQCRFPQSDTQESAGAKYSKWITHRKHRHARCKTYQSDAAHMSACSPWTTSQSGQHCSSRQSVRNQPGISRTCVI